MSLWLVQPAFISKVLLIVVCSFILVTIQTFAALCPHSGKVASHWNAYTVLLKKTTISFSTSIPVLTHPVYFDRTGTGFAKNTVWSDSARLVLTRSQRQASMNGR